MILVVIALALLASLGPGAHVASASRVVVAADAGARLFVDDVDRQLCITVESQQGSSGECDQSELGAVALAGEGDLSYAGITVPAAAVTVELRRAGALLAAGPTLAGEAYKGRRAGRVRFALLHLPASARTDGLRVRALAADGTLVGVLASTFGEGELVVASRKLLSGRSGRVRWSITASLATTLTPSVVDLAHESVSRCATVSVLGARSRAIGRSRDCIAAAPRDGVGMIGDRMALTQDTCAPRFRLLHGIVDGSVRRVGVLLGDGRRRVGRAAPFGDGQRLVYAIAIPTGAAVRSVTLDRGAAGATVRRLALAPLTVGCATGAAFGEPAFGLALDALSTPFADLPAVTPIGPVTAVAATPPFRIADGPGDTLCLALGKGPFHPLNCAIVSPSLAELLVASDDFGRPRAFAIAVPARVAAIRIGTFDGSSLRVIATVPGSGYGGSYAGRVRFASAMVAASRELSRLDLLDESGRILHSERGDRTSDEEEGPPRFLARLRVAGSAGHPSLWQTTLRVSKTSSSRCLALTNGPRPLRGARCQAQRSALTVLLEASCASRRLTVAVALSAGTRVRADPGGGRPSQAIRLRNGAGLLTLPSGRGLRSLTFVRAGRATKVPVEAPPGARQCGWVSAPPVTLARRPR